MTTGLPDVIILGAGAAGLAAAYTLKQAGIDVVLVEARGHVGGRAWTVSDLHRHTHVELGAEFIHGHSPALWQLIEQAGLPAPHAEEAVVLKRQPGPFQLLPYEFAALKPLLGRMGEFAQPDRSAAEMLQALEQEPGADLRLIAFFRRYIEGYNAASSTKIGVQSLVSGQEDDADSSGMDNYHLLGGYSTLMNWLADQIGKESIHLNQVVRKVTWKSHAVTVELEDGSTLRGKRLLSTLPVGVEKSAPSQKGHVVFQPDLVQRHKWLKSIEMGNVTRITLDFNEAFWSSHISSRYAFDAHDRVGIVVDEEPFMFWTYRSNGRLLWVAWSSGPRSAHMDKMNEAELITEAVNSFARTFALDADVVRQALVQADCHNWQMDPYARGAYSYIGVNGLVAQRALAKPIEDTVFFAGELLPPSGPTGLVSGAIGSGIRAAQEIKRSLSFQARNDF